MDEYIEREALLNRIRDAFCASCKSYHGKKCRACGIGDAIDMIEDAPAADVAPVVRCKDCCWRGREECSMFYRCECGEQSTWETDNDFCSYGERKDNE